MTDLGREKIEEAKKNGQWDSSGGKTVVTEEQIEYVADLLKDNELAYANFLKMSPSVKRTYTRHIWMQRLTPGVQSVWHG